MVNDLILTPKLPVLIFERIETVWTVSYNFTHALFIEGFHIFLCHLLK
jgi:hypothetical protein